ncbi:short-chain dehydrogenase [Saccharopolyspora subtropica]|uniref:SDR family NAD(P)-dependent oxidoreductase n=1 Tax=Saccharopolyspora thermophila TaxID=89367 RepID=A0A917K6T5_9PSEU|nr:SDR family oxidoreductase [Saccharopolyspora subtropica]GGJ02144.1 short-chain dehydrogenase [Saccharopolyspora subtropica]
MVARLTVITGGASGIGRQTALMLAAAGESVVVLDTDEPAAREVADQARAAGAAFARAVRCDVTDEASVTAAVGQLDQAPTGLVAAAGVDIGGLAHVLPVADWRRVLEVNLTGSFLIARAVIGRMLESGDGGSVVLCSSPAAFAGFAAGGTSAYAASKGGVSALVRALAVDYARHGIRVNAVVPGPTETPLMWAAVPEEDRAAMRETVCAEVPLGRLADPAEPANAVVWLLGPQSSYVTGAHLVCDGGVLAKASISV